MPVDERPPIPYVPELDDPNWKPVYGEIEFDCAHWGMCIGGVCIGGVCSREMYSSELSSGMTTEAVFVTVL